MRGSATCLQRFTNGYSKYPKVLRWFQWFFGYSNGSRKPLNSYNKMNIWNKYRASGSKKLAFRWAFSGFSHFFGEKYSVPFSRASQKVATWIRRTTCRNFKQENLRVSGQPRTVIRTVSEHYDQNFMIRTMTRSSGPEHYENRTLSRHSLCSFFRLSTREIKWTKFVRSKARRQFFVRLNQRDDRTLAHSARFPEGSFGVSWSSSLFEQHWASDLKDLKESGWKSNGILI